MPESSRSSIPSTASSGKKKIVSVGSDMELMMLGAFVFYDDHVHPIFFVAYRSISFVLYFDLFAVFTLEPGSMTFTSIPVICSFSFRVCVEFYLIFPGNMVAFIPFSRFISVDMLEPDVCFII